MSTWYKTVIHGNAEGQDITNTIYHGDISSFVVDDGASTRSTFLNDLDTNLTADLRAVMPSSYTLNRYINTVVSGRNETVSDFEVEKVINLQGTRAGSTAAVANCGILAFRNSSISGLTGNVVPKKTYMAMSPLLEGDVGQDGSWTFPSVPYDNLIAALMTTIPVGFGTYSFVRIGAHRVIGNDRVGLVASISPRPFTSWRRSRAFTPSGAS